MLIVLMEILICIDDDKHDYYNDLHFICKKICMQMICPTTNLNINMIQKFRCGPCKLVLPKYVELSDKYTNVIFLKCIGDASTEASALMKREGVRSVPSFHMWKGRI